VCCVDGGTVGLRGRASSFRLCDNPTPIAVVAAASNRDQQRPATGPQCVAMLRQGEGDVAASGTRQAGHGGCMLLCRSPAPTLLRFAPPQPHVSACISPRYSRDAPPRPRGPRRHLGRVQGSASRRRGRPHSRGREQCSRGRDAATRYPAQSNPSPTRLSAALQMAEHAQQSGTSVACGYMASTLEPCSPLASRPTIRSCITPNEPLLHHAQRSSLASSRPATAAHPPRRLSTDCSGSP
jgi:hypothetical protein